MPFFGGGNQVNVTKIKKSNEWTMEISCSILLFKTKIKTVWSNPFKKWKKKLLSDSNVVISKIYKASQLSFSARYYKTASE